MKFAPITAALVLLSGCTPQQATTATNAGATTVAGAEVALTAAEHVALTYTSQGLCPVKGPVVWSCRDPATVTRIKAYDQTAYTAVKQAEAGVATVAAAMAAIDALTAVVPASPTPIAP